ncbi:MAG: molybdopterin-guanine dinucleotide biosynthesis protein A [Crocinitomix sp.]|jgi:molybdopterin-guanine dinucleotide biosynthesis protein A
MEMVADITAIILAGGQSSRMGQDKGLMDLNGKPMIQYIIETVEPIANNIIIIANNLDYEKFGFPVYEDTVKEKGPLAGVVTGLSESKTDLNWIISCDTPYVTEGLLKELKHELKGFDAVLSSFQGRVHPLISAYNKSALQMLTEQLEKENLKLMLANSALKTKIFNANQYDLINFKNLNSKKDL